MKSEAEQLHRRIDFSDSESIKAVTKERYRAVADVSNSYSHLKKHMLSRFKDLEDTFESRLKSLESTAVMPTELKASITDLSKRLDHVQAMTVGADDLNKQMLTFESRIDGVKARLEHLRMTTPGYHFLEKLKDQNRQLREENELLKERMNRRDKIDKEVTDYINLRIRALWDRVNEMEGVVKVED